MNRRILLFAGLILIILAAVFAYLLGEQRHERELKKQWQAEQEAILQQHAAEIRGGK